MSAVEKFQTFAAGLECPLSPSEIENRQSGPGSRARVLILLVDVEAFCDQGHSALSRNRPLPDEAAGGDFLDTRHHAPR